MPKWMLGTDAVMPLTKVSARFIEVCSEVSADRPSVCSPWINVSALHSFARALRQPGRSQPRGSLMVDPIRLRILAKTLKMPGKHAVSRIVQSDIHAQIGIDVKRRMPKVAIDVKAAQSLLRNSTPWIGSLYDAFIRCVVPIIHRPNRVPAKRGFSSPISFGAMFLTFEERDRVAPWYIAQLSIDLAHEVGHHALYAYQTADAILSSDLEQPVYSGVKRMLRPAIMSFHASIALAYMIEAAKGLRKTAKSTCARWLDDQLATYRESQNRATAELLNTCHFTDLGFAILQELVEQVKSC